MQSLDSRITHVMVGYAVAVLKDLDLHLEADSLLVLEEPEIIQARDAGLAVERFRCVASVEQAPTQNEANPGDLVMMVPQPEQVCAVIPGADYGAVGAAALAQAWGLPGAGVRAAQIFRDKAALRQLADDVGIAQPDWQEITVPEEADRFRARHGGHCVLKPSNRQASLGVQIVGPDQDIADVWSHTADAKEATLRARHAAHTRLLCEERLIGPEYSTEAIVHEGVVRFFNITAKKVIAGPYPVEAGHTVPAPHLEPELQLALRSDTQKLVDASGFGTGMLHAEWIIRGGQPHLVECAGRPPGDGIVRLIDLAYAGDVFEDYLGLLRGEREVAIAATAKGGAAIAFVCPQPGVVRSVDGVTQAQRLPGVLEVEVTLNIGARISPVSSSWQRHGHVLATGPDAFQAADRVINALGMIEIELDSADSHP